MPVGIRGLVLAGVFATSMGSLSAALNALATSATNDWYLPRRPGRSEAHYVQAARVFTAVFAALMVAIATSFAYAKVTHPDIRIIPVVLGIASFILGPMLGVFLIGLFTRNRGSDRGNTVAVSLGLLATIVLGDLHITFFNGVAPLLGFHQTLVRSELLPKVSFTWFAMIGALVVFAVGVFFKTPLPILEAAKLRAEEAERDEDKPLALR
jgi:Na+/proline symporter